MNVHISLVVYWHILFTCCIAVNFSPEYAKYSSDEEDDDEEVLGEPFVREREIDEQEMDKVQSCRLLSAGIGLLWYNNYSKI